MLRLSDDSLFTFIDVAVDQLQRESYPNVGKCVTYRYDSDWYVGLACEKNLYRARFENSIYDCEQNH